MPEVIVPASPRAARNRVAAAKPHVCEGSPSRASAGSPPRSPTRRVRWAAWLTCQTLHKSVAPPEWTRLRSRRRQRPVPIVGHDVRSACDSLPRRLQPEATGQEADRRQKGCPAPTCCRRHAGRSCSLKVFGRNESAGTHSPRVQMTAEWVARGCHLNLAADSIDLRRE